MWNKLHKVWTLPRRDKHLLLKAWWYLFFFRYLLSRKGFNFSHQKARLATRPFLFKTEAAWPSPARIVSAIETASHYSPGSTCLVKALACMALLHKIGYKPVLQIGVRWSTGKALDAHAWLTLEGKVIMGGIPGMAQLKSLPLNHS